MNDVVNVVHLLLAEHELIAPGVGHQQAFIAEAVQPLGHLDQQFIPELVAEGVVEGLETVQVQHHQGNLAHLAIGNVQGVGQVFHEEPTVRQAGEGVGGFQSRQIFLNGGALRDFLIQFPAGLQQRAVALENELYQQRGQTGQQTHQQKGCKGHPRPIAVLAFHPFSGRAQGQCPVQGRQINVLGLGKVATNRLGHVQFIAHLAGLANLDPEGFQNPLGEKLARQHFHSEHARYKAIILGAGTHRCIDHHALAALAQINDTGKIPAAGLFRPFQCLAPFLVEGDVVADDLFVVGNRLQPADNEIGVNPLNGLVNAEVVEVVAGIPPPLLFGFGRVCLQAFGHAPDGFGVDQKFPLQVVGHGPGFVGQVCFYLTFVLLYQPVAQAGGQPQENQENHHRKRRAQKP